MGCSKGRIAPTDTTKLHLFADSGGFCQNPSCLSELFKNIDGDIIHIAEVAHVISAGDMGPRADARLTPEQRAKYENLLLLCPTCHEIIDKAESSYPEQMLQEWKHSHKERIKSQFGFVRLESRAEARIVLSPILHSNKTIFDAYGPLNEERYNPESSLPRIWLRKIRSTIIPNNRKILTFCDLNRHLLSDKEFSTLELFRQHIDDFEAKHILGVEPSGLTFPKDVSTLFL